MFKVPEKYRITTGYFGSDSTYGNNGIFAVPINKGNMIASCIASDGEGWEHVSITLFVNKIYVKRCPTWDEMNQIKDIFWDGSDCVIQFHPPKEDYVNNDIYCLHLWRPIGIEIPRPHYSLVGTK